MKNKKVTSYWTKKGNTKCSGLSIFKVSKTKDSFSALKSIFHAQHLFLDIWLWFLYMGHEKNQWNEESLHKFCPFLGQIWKKFLIFLKLFFLHFSMKYLNNLKKVTQARIPLGFLSSSMYKEAIIMGLVWACVTFVL